MRNLTPLQATAAPTTHLLIVNHQQLLHWILNDGHMAFEELRADSARRAVRQHDEALIYATADCFRGSARGKVIALATVTSAVRTLEQPVTFQARRFVAGCSLRVHGLAPYGEGVDLRGLVPDLGIFRGHSSWGVRLRRPFATASPRDADLIRRDLQPFLRPYGATIGGYDIHGGA
ncbi:hypothetical protein [Streptomyces sp. NPDC097640]|uniref:hypothetical protein n=1 Tax=Streptomyces sp. NPDC097640 TaxID=3157229 RepID=UPI00331CE419